MYTNIILFFNHSLQKVGSIHCYNVHKKYEIYRNIEKRSISIRLINRLKRYIVAENYFLYKIFKL